MGFQDRFRKSDLTVMTHPKIIQGGMGIAVSSWGLARAVSLEGQLGVVSGTAIDAVLVRRLQLGDLDGTLREALAHFPVPEIANRILKGYYVPGGKAPDAPFKAKPILNIDKNDRAVELVVVANFCEVWLAKHGHEGLVGINLLEKIQLPNVPSLFGAMLADVDYVLMGAGIPRAIPGVLDKLAALEVTELKLDVTGAGAGQEFTFKFDPKRFCPPGLEGLKRPKFLAIVSSSVLAVSLAKKCTSPVDGFVVEAPTAGGHNAPPRGQMTLDSRGEPIYGPRDEPDFSQIAALGLPFWLAGSRGSAEGLEYALSIGAAGIQVGTAFAFCSDSGLDPAIRQRVLWQSKHGSVSVFTDPQASPTGFPFKVVEMDETVSDQGAYEARSRICDLGYLRELYTDEEGKVGYRCGSEPHDDYERKGGDQKETVGRKCVCNALMGTIGLGQVRKDGYVELPIITAGNEVVDVAGFLAPGADSYTAKDVIDTLLGKRSLTALTQIAAEPVLA